MMSDEQFERFMTVFGKRLDDHDLMLDIRGKLETQMLLTARNREVDAENLGVLKGTADKAHTRIDTLEKTISIVVKKQDRTHYFMLGAAAVAGAVWAFVKWILAFFATRPPHL